MINFALVTKADI